MQSLTLLVTSCFLIAISYSAPDLDASALGENSFNFLDDSSISSNPFDDSSIAFNLLDDSSIQGTNSLDQSTDSGIDWFPDTDAQLSQTSESDSSFFLADDINCDAINADDTQLFGKRRRDTSCKIPDVEIKDPVKMSNPSDPFALEQVLRKASLMADFKKSFESCPAKIFGDSNIPACTTKSSLLVPTATLAVTLYDVDPGAFACGYKFESSNLRAKNC